MYKFFRENIIMKNYLKNVKLFNKYFLSHEKHKQNKPYADESETLDFERTLRPVVSILWIIK